MFKCKNICLFFVVFLLALRLNASANAQIVGPTVVTVGETVTYTNATNFIYLKWGWDVFMWEPQFIWYSVNNRGQPPDQVSPFTYTFEFPGIYEVYLTASGGDGPWLNEWIIVTVVEDESQTSPEEQIESVVEEVSNIINEPGVKLSKGNVKALTSKLTNAIESIEDEEIADAIDQLGAFINQVEAMIRSRRLPPGTGYQLIEEVQEIIDNLGS
ncbi:hypothetical protein ACFL7D_11175 [candidate division KSB1 bacterium]